MAVQFGQLQLNYALLSGLSPQGSRQVFSEGESTFWKKVKSKNARSSCSPALSPQCSQRQQEDPSTTLMDNQMAFPKGHHRLRTGPH